MLFESWVLLIGTLLLVMGLTAAYVTRLPFTPTMVYLGIGIALGPAGLGVANFDPDYYHPLFYRGAELAVIVSLFTVGLKLRLSLGDRRWRPPLVLAFASMTLTVGLLAAVGVWGLGLPLGAAVLLGAILAPTDPVLASEVQLRHPGDRDRLRRALSGEAGFNDGTAFPFVMLGLGLLGLHDLGAGLWRWWAIDVAWATFGGLGIGSLLGYGVGKVVVALRRRQHDPTTFDEYLLFGLIGVSYGLALAAHTYGFLAVFAAGVAVRAVERRHGGDELAALDCARLRGATEKQVLADPRLAPAYLANSMLSLNEQLERILEVGMVLLVGVGLFSAGVPLVAWWFVPLLFLVIRPLAVLPVWRAASFTRAQFFGIAWFGVRGIGSIYYLMFAISRELPPHLAQPLMSLTFTTVAASVVIHGVSATPLLRWFRSHPPAPQA
ncbi:MAG: sodium:proton antiporter [Opitutus sp.]|nr:sodium:proton antiporter [Opitutus sp.]